MSLARAGARPGGRELTSIALLTFVLLVATAWARPLMLPDEGRYAGVAWEMLRSGHWATPMLDGLPFFHKPPLFYWISAATMSVFGVNAWAARSASLLGAWVATMGMFAFAYRWHGKVLAWWVALVLLAQPLFFIGAQFANLDMLVAGCITATVLLAAHAALTKEAALPFKRALLGAYAFAAFGVLAKGLIGFVLPGMVVVVWLLAIGRGRTLWSLWSWTGLLLFLAIAAPWFVVMQSKYPDFLNYFFVVQHFKRFASSGFNNVQPWWFYAALLLLAHVFWAPWLYRMGTPTALAGARRDPVRLLMWIWMSMVVVFFSLPESKLIGYVLPAIPPLVYLICDRFTAQAAPVHRRWWLAGSVLAAVTALMAIGWLAVHPMKSNRALALALRAAHTADEPVLMLGNYYYDVSFYAGLQQPPVVVDVWDDPNIAQSDNWRKEVADAASFDPTAASSILALPVQLPALVCAHPVSWVIGPVDQAKTVLFLQHAQEVHRNGEIRLWRVERAEAEKAHLLHCTGTSDVG
nr:glycosyltransferase family 39 protein [uncultured Albidiferax sp.]